MDLLSTGLSGLRSIAAKAAASERRGLLCSYLQVCDVCGLNLSRWKLRPSEVCRNPTAQANPDENTWRQLGQSPNMGADIALAIQSSLMKARRILMQMQPFVSFGTFGSKATLPALCG